VPIGNYGPNAAAYGNAPRTQQPQQQQYPQQLQAYPQQPYPAGSAVANQQQRGVGKSPSASMLPGGQSVGAPGSRSAALPPTHQSPPQLKSTRTGAVGAPLTAVNERRIPPPAPAALSGAAGDGGETGAAGEELTRYYKAFASRAKVGRTPISSAYALPGEFDGAR